jgi:hypothetical protein
VQARIFWGLAVAAWFAAIWLFHRTDLAQTAATHGAAILWGYGIEFFFFGVILLGAVARWWRTGSPALWRPVMLSLGSLGAAVELALRPQVPDGSLVDQWMAALLGLVLVAILARLLPYRINSLWLGLDRRTHSSGP